jgi:D-lactate dehydrogenase
MHACPVGIDTGKLIKQLRHEDHGERAERSAEVVAEHARFAERAARAGLRGGGAVIRAWRTSVPGPSSGLPFTVREGAAAVYMPACINRIFGNARDDPPHPTLPEALVAISRRAGLPLWVPDDVIGHCCGTPWTSKGYVEGHEVIAERVRAALERWSDRGRLPVVIDASSCAHGLISEVGIESIQVLDSVAWVHDHLLERLRVSHKLDRIAVHPTCASRHLGLSEKLAAIASSLGNEVVVPAATSCCGMAGDRGWLHPELPESALRGTARELDGARFDACVSSNRTCEVALREVTGRPYTSFVLVLEELTRE